MSHQNHQKFYHRFCLRFDHGFFWGFVNLSKVRLEVPPNDLIFHCFSYGTQLYFNSFMGCTKSSRVHRFYQMFYGEFCHQVCLWAPHVCGLSFVVLFINCVRAFIARSISGSTRHFLGGTFKGSSIRSVIISHGGSTSRSTRGFLSGSTRVSISVF